MREKRSDVDSGQCRDLMSVIYLANAAQAVQRADDFAAGQYQKGRPDGPPFDALLCASDYSALLTSRSGALCSIMLR